MKNTHVWQYLRAKYPETEYALMQEVSDAAGFSRSRSADYIVYSLYPSRGLHMSGIELKSNRGDWLKELKQPQKAENIFRYCDFFWLLTTDEMVAKLEEIPMTWGWMCIKGGKIHIKKPAPKLEPAVISKSFLAALLKRACDKKNFVPIDSIEDKIAEAGERGKEHSKNRLEKLERDYAELKKEVFDFRQASGIDLRDYRWNTSPTTIGKAVKFIEGGGAESLRKDLLKLEETAKNIHQQICDGLEILKQQMPNESTSAGSPDYEH